MTFPLHRGRRLRRTPALRAMARETHLSVNQLVAPLFVCEGRGVREPIASMPGHARLSPDLAAAEAADLARLGITSVLLFGIPSQKDAIGSGAWDPDGPVPDVIRRIKRDTPSLAVWADVCLCEYTDHGHCGILEGGSVDNDPTLPLLAQAAVAYARAGADVIAPSDMMDGRVGRIRGRSTRRATPTRRHRLLRGQVRFGVLRTVPRCRRARRRSWAIAAAIRWIRRTSARRCAKRPPTSTRARTW